MKAFLVAGARPNFIKIAPLLRALDHHDHVRSLLLHTGQHYDYEMSMSFFRQLKIREPDIFLGVGSGSHARQTAEIMNRLEAIIVEEEPDVVVLVGDVNSTLAGALAAVKIHYADGRRPLIAHVEAGLRSFDRTMPEEINRLLTDAVSDYLFTTCEDANINLAREGHAKEKIHFTGNVMIDTLLEHIDGACVPAHLGVTEGKYALLTLHRPSNVDDPESLGRLMRVMGELADRIPVIFPAHPRTQKHLSSLGIEGHLVNLDSLSPVREGCVNVLSPLPYLEFIALMKGAGVVLTDSGGIQEETTVLGIPCLTLRENTERPVTIRSGTNVLVGSDPDRIIAESRRALAGEMKRHRVPELWDGHAGERIAAVLAAGA